jgi:hypothetical protein
MKRRLNITNDRILAVDDTRIGFLHANKVVDDEKVEKVKVLSFGQEYNQPNFFVPIRRDGHFGIPVAIFKGGQQLHVQDQSSSSSHPVLTCFTPSSHTTSESYAAELSTSVKHSLPNGGMLIHDSDKTHLTTLVSITLNMLNITPNVVPPGTTGYCNPCDRIVNALIQKEMCRAQRRFMIRVLEENGGTIPHFSASYLRSLFLSWFRNAYYSLSLESRLRSWTLSGLFLADDGSEDSKMSIVIAPNVEVTARDVRNRVAELLITSTSLSTLSFPSFSLPAPPPQQLQHQLSQLLTGLQKSKEEPFSSQSQLATSSIPPYTYYPLYPFPSYSSTASYPGYLH